MSAGGIVLSGGGTSVDFSDLNCSVQYVMNNPLFIMPLPTPYTGAISQQNQIVADLKLQTTKITLTFDLLDGISASTTKFFVIQKMTQQGGPVNPLSFTWGAFTSKVAVETFIAGTGPGKKDFMPTCTLVLVPSII